MYILNKSGEHDELPIWEAWSLLGFDHCTIYDNFVLVKEIDLTLASRLGYTKSIFKVIFSSEFSIIEQKTKEFDFNKIISKRYKVYYEGFTSKVLHDLVWRSLKDPKVDLHDPEQKLYFIRIGDHVHCCLMMLENKYDFDSRSPHKRLGLKPISLKPRLARCLVNLTGCKKGTIVDPFTGTSGIPIEAMLCGLKSICYDIDQEMLDISRNNFLEMKLSSYKLERKNFFDIDKKMDYIVTDLPYGKNTKDLDKGFYERVAVKLNKIIGRRAIIAFPDHINVNMIFKKARKIRIIKTFRYYIHQSMSKIICVIEPV